MSENSGSTEIGVPPPETAVSTRSSNKEVYSRTKSVIASLINNLPENDRKVNEQEPPVDRAIGNINFLRNLTSKENPVTELLLESMFRRGERARGIIEICKIAKVNVPMITGDYTDYTNSILLFPNHELGRIKIMRAGRGSTDADLDTENIKMDNLMSKFSKMSHKDILTQISKNLVPFSLPFQK